MKKRLHQPEAFRIRGVTDIPHNQIPSLPID
jgi:hypothetical protein